MARRKKSSHLYLNPGWAIYLRTSDKDAQNLENSQRRQRSSIDRALLEKSDLPVIGEYIDNFSGRYANREGYQRMLADARSGKFSHVAVENAERFGRNDAEALTVIDELDDLGISIRFADYSELNPIDPDDRILISLSFALARRESIKLGQRVSGGLLAKMRNGGYVGRVPDGYRNAEEKVDTNTRTLNGRYHRWIEQDPDQAKVWRLAWDLLLEDRHTLAEICEELHSRGYTYRTGRPFVVVKDNGKHKANKSTLSATFHNWTYAGWVWSDVHNIPPKTIRGNWKPIVTTEEFERGLAILERRTKNRVAKRKHDYLLKNLIYVDLPAGPKLEKLTGSTSNPSRSGGGTAYYCVPGSNINIMCSIVDRQIPYILQNIQVHPDLLPLIRAEFERDVTNQVNNNPKQKSDLEAALKAIDEEEARAARLFAAGKISDSVRDNLWAEWQDRRNRVRTNLAAAEANPECHVNNLEDALNIFSKIGVLHEKPGRKHQKELLRQVVKQVVVNPAGEIIQLELLPPFAYLNKLVLRMDGRVAASGNKKTDTMVGRCSDYIQYSGRYRTRTCNLFGVNEALCQLS